MTGRIEKPEHIPRKRALVSCDRCKLRRARCVRSRPEETCADCKASGVRCEQKLPRKQRVYGSVETLSLRFRALECLVKGLFPAENVGDTDTLFKIAASRNVEMPANDDYTPAEIFKPSPQQSYPTPHGGASDTIVTFENATPAAASVTASATTASSPNPFLDRPPPSQPSEKLIPTLYGVPHYFGACSSFKLAIQIRTMVARCNALPEARSILRQSSFCQPDPTAAANSSGPLPKLLNSQLSEDGSQMSTDSRHTSLHDDARPTKRVRTSIEQTERQIPKSSSNETVEDFLPPRSVAEALVAAYFDQVHMFMPLFHRSMFQFRYEQSWSRKHTLLKQNEETGWLCCLALIFAFGAQVLEKHDPERARELQKKYLGYVRVCFRKLAMTTSLVNVQALMLLQLYDHNAGRRSNSFMLIGTAARMAISMGMHREGSNAEFDPIERHTRRLVWWSLQVFEKITSFILGRPTCIDDLEVSTRVPDENMLESKEIPPDMFEKGLEVAKLSYQIRRRAYRFDEAIGNSMPPVSTAKTLLKELDEWQGSLPVHLGIDYPNSPKQRRAVLLLHVYYFYIRCIVTRNYLIQKVERNIRSLENSENCCPGDDPEHLQAAALSEDCIVSAFKSLQCLNIISDLGFLNGVSWLDVFFVFHAVLIVCADFLARPKEQVDSYEDVRRKDSVRTILRSTGAIKLAPTYNILSQIAFQFASITGATDEPYASQHFNRTGTTTESSVPPPTPQTPSFTGDGMPKGLIEVSNPAHDHDWYENEAANIPWWDFFDIATQGTGGAGGAGGNLGFNNYYAHAYSGVYLDPGTAAGDGDEWTRGQLKGTQKF